MKFHLLAPHYASDVLIAAGSLVGDGERNTWRNSEGEPFPPSSAMEGADDEGREIIDKFRAGRGLPAIQAPPTFAEAAPISKSAAAHLEMRKVRGR